MYRKDWVENRLPNFNKIKKSVSRKNLFKFLVMKAWINVNILLFNEKFSQFLVKNKLNINLALAGIKYNNLALFPFQLSCEQKSGCWDNK